ncbi:MAG: hypothetical protein H7Z10_13925, partial [Gemmatimonadaceae bacterium]|nr:hypothetical protein [Acetobacteraceae bacterium]
MSDAHDERLALSIEEGVLLWSIRSWVMELRRPAGHEPRIDDMLDRFGVPDAAPYLKGFMFALSHGAARMINVQCVCCTSIGEDERALLDVLGLAQALRPFEALLLLHGLVTPAGARAALCSAEGMGTVLADAGRFLPAPEEEVRRYAIATGSMYRPA